MLLCFSLDGYRINSYTEKYQKSPTTLGTKIPSPPGLYEGPPHNPVNTELSHFASFCVTGEQQHPVSCPQNSSPIQAGLMAHTYHPSTREAEAGTF